MNRRELLFGLSASPLLIGNFVFKRTGETEYSQIETDHYSLIKGTEMVDLVIGKDNKLYRLAATPGIRIFRWDKPSDTNRDGFNHVTFDGFEKKELRDLLALIKNGTD